MKSLIRKILLREYDKSKPLNNREVILFNKLNEKNKEYKTKSEKISLIKDLCKYLGLDPDLSQYYYLLWKSNYRKSGDYGNVSPEEFIGPRDLPQRTISNTKANQFAKAKAPFKGSNLKGYWGTDDKGVEYYVITSYSWYPIYLFKQDKWYRASNTYSSSTSRQMANANPVSYDDYLGHDITWVTKQEMDALMRNATYEDIMNFKVKDIVKKKEQFISKKPKFATNWGWGVGFTPIKVRFKVTDIREENGKAIVDVTIDDAGERERNPGNMETTNRMIPSEGGYLKGSIPGVNKEKVEDTIKNRIIHNFKDYVGKFPNYVGDIKGYDFEATPEKHAIKFNFIHSKE